MKIAHKSKIKNVPKKLSAKVEIHPIGTWFSLSECIRPFSSKYQSFWPGPYKPDIPPGMVTKM
jgi:hypothetical protein